MPWKQVESMEQRPQFIQDARRRLVSFTKSVDHRRYIGPAPNVGSRPCRGPNE